MEERSKNLRFTLEQVRILAEEDNEDTKYLAEKWIRYFFETQEALETNKSSVLKSASILATYDSRLSYQVAESFEDGKPFDTYID